MMTSKQTFRLIVGLAVIVVLLITDISTQAFGTGTIVRASIASFGGEANDGSVYGVVSPNGKVVAFETYATNLVGGDLSTAWDILVHDFETERTEWISVSDSEKGGNAHSLEYPLKSGHD